MKSKHDIYITVLTTTYNRGKLIKELYLSLCNQTVFNFQWLIIDDGSTDDTKNIVAKFNKRNFQIDYVYKSNTGKCNSINFAHKYIKGNYTFIVDSDDVLMKDAISEAINYIDKFYNNEKIACWSFHKMLRNGKFCSPQDKGEIVISDHITYRINNKLAGDRAEILRTDILKKFPFPEYKNEKFMSEVWLWNTVAYEYDTVYINKAIYICEYLADGLSNNLRENENSSLNRVLITCNSFFSSKVKLKIRLKYLIVYIIYGKKAGHNFWIITSNCKYRILCILFYLPAILYYKIIYK